VLDAGHLLDNRYRLDERIATGGMGDVWKGTDVVLGRVVAVKVLRSTMMSDPEFAARFYGEARMMAAFRHPGVVEVYDYASAGDSDDEEQCAYLVMAYVEGEPLSTRLKEAGRLGVAETMSIVAQAADALHAAHQAGTVHRDVKPGNLIVKPTGAVILVDFGVARSAAVTSVTGVNSIVGTALYMAPEQVAKGNVTPATDIYALGAVAYHCLAGHPPFDGDNALQVALRHLDEDPEPLPDDVPYPVRDLISRAMAKHPEDRFASAAEFADAALAAGAPAGATAVAPGLTGTALTRTVLTSPIGATPTRTVAVPRQVSPGAAPLPPPRRRRSRGQLAVLLTVIALILTAVGLAIALAFTPDDGDTRLDPTPTASVEQTESAEPEVPVAPLPSDDDTQEAPRPNGQSQRPSRSATPTTPPTTTRPTTTAPTPTTTTTTPSPDPTTTQPTDPTDPTTTPTDDTEAGGGGTDG
jgi:eukaryotic-like serine/threonine-protein kinase